MMNNNSRPAKKRKASNCQATTDCAHDNNIMSTGSTNGGGLLSSWFGYFSGRRDDASSRPPCNEHSIQQSLSTMDRMEKIMMRMEDKLATVSNTVSTLKSQCQELERKCNTLETIVESTSRIDKTLKYHEMMIKNQKWEYSAPIYTRHDLMYSDYPLIDADYMFQTSTIVREKTVALRRGDFPDVKNDNVVGDMGILLDIDIDYDLPLSNEVTDGELTPQWEEFAAALRHFKPAFDVLSDDCKTFISFTNIQLNRDNVQLVKEALRSMPFKHFRFQQNCQFYGGINTFAAIMDNNIHLQQLKLHRVRYMDRNDIAALSSAIQRHPSLVDITISECFRGGLGNAMLTSLLRIDEWKLKSLSMPGNALLGSQAGLNACTLLTDFLATNPNLTNLDLPNNRLNDNDAVLIANALGSNTMLRYVDISENRKTVAGVDILERALYDGASLNSAADSNHSCFMYADLACIHVNDSNVREINRAKKISFILSSRNKTAANVQHFGDIDVKLLPNILEAVQKYLRLMDGYQDIVVALSVVYEIMRRWDKVSPLFKALGKSGR